MTTTLSKTFLPELGNRRQGKVRDIYENGKTLTFVTSDRISVFDCVLNEAIPQKGHILNELSRFWFEKTKDIIPNHLMETVDSNVWIVKKCNPLMVEVIVRNYLTGSLWRDYKAGKRVKCGIEIPEGLKEHQQLPHPIVTPTTKSNEGHDEDITKEELVAQGIVTKELWEMLETKSLELFKRGQEILSEKGVILVDTKYEFGIDDENNLTLIDEIHTPDSSRFWFQKDLDRKEIKFPDKEFARSYCMSQGFMGNGTQPPIPSSIVDEIHSGYRSVFEAITGQKLEGTAQTPTNRVLEHLKKSKLIKGYFVLIITGSEKDQPHVDKITAQLDDSGIPHSTFVASAHKTPKKTLSIIDEYNQSLEPIVCITVAGRSNALSGLVAANLRWPVIACPPFKDHADYLANIHSSTQMPSNVPSMVVIDPKNAAMAAERILKTMELSL
ncbi:MAG: phosphoribosylaminoimidazolesuccinocarboxamide synthase [Chlamydiota bacterium]|nr:phosphoribosylaminoimidazolesuccinocarboxamide synthase [Chlamydiota bacterium]